MYAINWALGGKSELLRMALLIVPPILLSLAASAASTGNTSGARKLKLSSLSVFGAALTVLVLCYVLGIGNAQDYLPEFMIDDARAFQVSIVPGLLFVTLLGFVLGQRAFRRCHPAVPTVIGAAVMLLGCVLAWVLMLVFRSIMVSYACCQGVMLGAATVLPMAFVPLKNFEQEFAPEAPAGHAGVQPAADQRTRQETAPAQAAVSLSDSPKSKVIAALLAFFLGTMGAHRYYLGYKKEGMIQTGGLASLIVGWAVYIPAMADDGVGLLPFAVLALLYGAGVGIWVFADFIRILIGSLAPADGSAYKENRPMQVQMIQPAASNSVDALEKLSRLHDQGILTDEEFRQKKNDILAKL